MRRKSWQRVKKLLFETQKLPEDEREEYLRREAGGSKKVINAVKRLLDADTSPLQTSELQLRVEMPTKIGTYQPNRLLGSGGMADVFLATRREKAGEFFAIKLFRESLPPNRHLQFFRHERKILARVAHHPYTRSYFGSGISSSGRPYLVLEYVEGLPLSRFCTNHSLSFKDRLILFCKICKPVEMAHRNKIVHLDLKPGNILVKEDGEPRLLDFGIARSIGDESFDQMPISDHLTIGWASPEQLRHQALGRKSDIYSLGLILTLLTKGRDRDPEADQRDIDSSPSIDCTSEERLKALIHRALEEDPAKRYPDVKSMIQGIADIQALIQT